MIVRPVVSAITQANTVPVTLIEIFLWLVTYKTNWEEHLNIHTLVKPGDSVSLLGFRSIGINGLFMFK